MEARGDFVTKKRQRYYFLCVLCVCVCVSVFSTNNFACEYLAISLLIYIFTMLIEINRKAISRKRTLDFNFGGGVGVAHF